MKRWRLVLKNVFRNRRRTLMTTGYRVGGAMPNYIQLDALTIVFNLLVALVVSLASTLLPAWRASHVSIARALRYVE